MTDISIQFHASPSELFAFAEEITEEFELHVVAMKFFPFDAVEIDTSSLASIFNGASVFTRLAFTIPNPILPVVNELDFTDKNPDHLRLEIGRMTEGGLEQSWLTARTENRRVMSVWKRIAKKLKERTKQGVIAVNRDSGVSAQLRSFRYSPGAKKLEASGLAMIPPQGPNGPRLILGESDSASIVDA